MEVILSSYLSGMTSNSTGLDRAALRLRSVTPQQATSSLKSGSGFTPSRFTSDEFSTTIPTTTYPETATQVTSNSLVSVGDANQFSNEFLHSIQFSGNLDQIENARNSIALKLIRSHLDKASGLVMLTFDFIFCPSKSFMFELFF